MLAGNNADRNFSEKKMEGDDGSRTLECLRGRLIAERAASRVAKDDAELMGNKLIELENQLREEIKSKNKAEKKLKFLKKKIGSLKINCPTENSEMSNSSDNFESSCSSSSTFSVTKNPEEDQNAKPQFTGYEKCRIEEISHNSSDMTSSNQDHTSPSSKESSSPQNYANPNHNSDHKDDSLENFCRPESIQSCQDSNNDDHSSKASMEEIEINGGNESVAEDEDVDNSFALVLVPPSLQSPLEKAEVKIVNESVAVDENVDNSLALVLVPPNLQAPLEKAEVKMVNESVGEVLDALRHAREKLQSSMERRHVIKFGSFGTQIC